MTGKEALFASLTLSAADALRESETSESATMRMVCGWKLNEPVHYHEIVEAAGIVAVIEQPEGISFAERAGVNRLGLAEYFSKWHTYQEACKDLNDNYFNVKSRVAVLKKKGWTVEKRRRFPNIPGNFEYRVTPKKEQAA